MTSSRVSVSGISGIPAAGSSTGAGGGGSTSGGGGGRSGGTPIPLMIPVTSVVPPAASGKRIVTVLPCTAVPTVVPLQVVWRAAVTAPQAKLSSVVGPPRPNVVAMKTAGRLPTATPVGPVALSVNVIEPTCSRNVPATPPVATQRSPAASVQGTPVWPDGGGAF